LPLAITGNPAQVAAAIDGFPATYHADFFRVRPRGRAYATTPVSNAAAMALAQPLRDVLLSWGAGTRKAPMVRSLTEIESTLAAAPVHTALRALHDLPLSKISVSYNRRSFLAIPTTQAALDSFDTNLFVALHALAKGLFIANTNATYPLKAALLITGLMPAFDSRVRRGLQRGGFGGTNKTQFVLPGNANCPDGKKIASLLFLLGECWLAYSNQINAGISSSNYRELLDEPGRFFDVLLFMQGDSNNPVLVSYHGSQRWYALR